MLPMQPAAGAFTALTAYGLSRQLAQPIGARISTSHCFSTSTGQDQTASPPPEDTGASPPTEPTETPDASSTPVEAPSANAPSANTPSAKRPAVLNSATQLASMLRHNIYFQTGDEYSMQTKPAIAKRARNAMHNALAKHRVELSKPGGMYGALRGGSLQDTMQQNLKKLQQMHDL